MNSPPLSVVIDRLLQTGGRIQADQSCTLRPRPLNPERRDYATRQQYLVLLDENPVAIATVGPDLDGLRQRTDLFSHAFAEIACGAIGFEKSPEGDVLVTEYFPGIPLDRAGLPPEQMGDLFEEYGARFKEAAVPSTTAEAEAELRELFHAVIILPYWTRADRAFLTCVVFPLIEQELIEIKPMRRPSNGDFIARNILIGPNHTSRIIDYEFACNTHFFAEDWLRLTYWDTHPICVREFATAQVPNPPFQTLYLALKQLVIEYAVNLPQKAQADARLWCAEIRRQLETSTNELHQAMLWSVGWDQSNIASPVSAQLFWLTHDGWDPIRSLCVDASLNRPCRLYYRIPPGPACHGFRFDPGEMRCAITIHSIRIESHDPATNKTVGRFAASNTVEFDQLQAAGDAIIISKSSDPQFEVVSIGSDPQLHLLEVGVPNGQAIDVEIVAAFTTDPVAQLVGLRQYVHAQVNHARQVRQEAKASLVRMEEFATWAQRLESSHQEEWADLRNSNALQATEFSARWSALQQQLQQQFGGLTALLYELQQLNQSANTALATVATTSAEQASTIGRLTTELGALRSERQKFAADLQILTARHATAQARTQAAESKAEQLTQFLAGHGRTIDRLELALAAEVVRATQAETEILRLNQALSVESANHHHVEDQLGKLAQEIAGLRERVLAQSESLHRGTEREACLQESLGRRTEENARLIGELASTRTRLATEQEAAQHLRSSLETERSFHNFVTSSRSWRWTAPCRKLFTCFSRKIS